MAHLLKVVAADNSAFKTTIGAGLQTLNPGLKSSNLCAEYRAKKERYPERSFLHKS